MEIDDATGNIGFINVQRPYRRWGSGGAPAWVLPALQTAQQRAEVEAHRGMHECDGNDGHKSGREFSLAGFCWPEMLSHYIADHGYMPPQNFLDLLRQLPAGTGLPASTFAGRPSQPSLPDALRDGSPAPAGESDGWRGRARSSRGR